MTEYVKRFDVNAACYNIYEEVKREHKAMTAEEVKQTMLRFEKAINLTPAADVVEVIRCKDCKLWTGKDYDGCCIKNALATRYANDFCSYGERKDT